MSTAVLAGGSSSRMGSPKALLKIGARTFLEHIVDLHRIWAVETHIVLGSDHALIEPQLKLPRLKIIVNRSVESGPLSSLLLALEQTNPRSTGLISHPVDHPLVMPSTIQAILREHRRHPKRILLPEFQGRTGHPVLFPSWAFSDLKAAPLEVGARWVVKKNRDSVARIEVDDEGILANIDSPADYDRWIAPRQ